MLSETKPMFDAVKEIETAYEARDFDDLHAALEEYNALDVRYLRTVFPVDRKAIDMIAEAEKLLRLEVCLLLLSLFVYILNCQVPQFLTIPRHPNHQRGLGYFRAIEMYHGTVLMYYGTMS